MKRNYAVSFGLPELPPDIDELSATGNTGKWDRLECFVGQIPGIDRTRFEHLSRIACRTSRATSTKSGTSVLRLRDLLRKQPHGHVTIHPRVTHVFHPEEIDPFLQEIAEIYDEGRQSGTALQYPRRVLECREKSSEVQVLYPSSYNAKISDVMRDIRANGILTSIRKPGEPFPSREHAWSVLEQMQSPHEIDFGLVTLYQPVNELEPNLYIDTGTRDQHSDIHGDLESLCFSICRRHCVALDLLGHEERP